MGVQRQEDRIRPPRTPRRKGYQAARFRACKLLAVLLTLGAAVLLSVGACSRAGPRQQSAPAEDVEAQVRCQRAAVEQQAACRSP